MRGGKCSLAWMEKHRDFLLSDVSLKEKVAFFCFSEREVSNLITAIRTKENLQEKITKPKLTSVSSKETETLEPKKIEFDSVSPTHYVAIASAPKDEQLEIAQRVVDEGLTVKQTQSLIKEAKGGTVSFKKRSFDVWSIAAIDLRKPFGDPSYPGAIPGDIVANVLMWFLPDGGKVVDPMAGGAVTEDVCNYWEDRYECQLYDNFTLDYDYRDSITFNDIMTGALPVEARDADLVFVDPPYGPLKEYGSPVEGHLLLMEKLAEACYDTLKEEGIVSVLMQNYYEGGECVGTFVPLVRYTTEIFEKRGFKQIFEVTVPLYGKVARSKEHMTHLDRRLMVFRK